MVHYFPHYHSFFTPSVLFCIQMKQVRTSSKSTSLSHFEIRLLYLLYRLSVMTFTEYPSEDKRVVYQQTLKEVTHIIIRGFRLCLIG